MILSPTSDNSFNIKTSSIFGMIFILGFLTVNIPLLGQGEYQPVILLLLAFMCLRSRPHGKPCLWISYCALATITFVLAVYHIFDGNLNLVDLIRLSVGPLFLVASLSIIRSVPLWVFKFIIGFHFLFFLIGILDPSLAKNIMSWLGLRGAGAYGGWNSYFSSEPSYFAINMSGLFTLMYLKCKAEGEPLQSYWVFLCALLLISTVSTTGLVFALFLLIIKFTQASYKIKLGLTILVFMGISTVTLKSMDRLINLFDIISANHDFYQIIMAINAVDPSGLWRILFRINFRICLGTILTSLI